MSGQETQRRDEAVEDMKHDDIWTVLRISQDVLFEDVFQDVRHQKTKQSIHCGGWRALARALKTWSLMIVHQQY